MAAQIHRTEPSNLEHTMSNPKANIRLTLTPEQKEMVKNQTGKSAEAVEFSVQELEERIAPTTAVPLD
jgi:hypothetical protein